MPKRVFYYDLIERTLWTGAQAALGFWIDYEASGEFTYRGALYAAGIAIAKALLVNQLPWTAPNSASTLPAEVDPPAGE